MRANAFTAQPDHLRIEFDRARAAHYHYFWLRHHCPCCIHPTTDERILNPSAVPLDIQPERVTSVADGVALDWPDGHRSEFTSAWLAAHRYSTDDLYHNDAGPTEHIEVAYADIAADLVAACEKHLADRGAILVRHCALDTEALVARFAERGFAVRSTHFGYIEDLKTDNTTNDNTDQLGYTDAAVELHTDMPFIEVPPRYQILQCMTKAERGGDSMLADARQAALHLRDRDRHAFDMLTQTPVLFHRQQQKYESKVTFPILTFTDGEFAQARTSYFTFAPLAMPYDQMEQWYRAYQKFTRIIEDYQYSFLLEPGDFVLYDNFRMLHGRTSFAGARWMRGIYLDREAG